MRKRHVKINEFGGDTYIYKDVDAIEIIEDMVYVFYEGDKKATHLLNEAEILIINCQDEEEEPI